MLDRIWRGSFGPSYQCNIKQIYQKRSGKKNNKTKVMLTHRPTVPSGPHAMLPAESIVFLFDRFEHKRRRVDGLLDWRQLTVLLEMDPAVCAQQDVLPSPVMPVLRGCGDGFNILV